MTGHGSLVDRMAALPGLSDIPRWELEKLAALGKCEKHAAGDVIFSGGKRVEKLYVILSGRMAVRVDRGNGPKRIMGWPEGEVSGQLPFSRMKAPPGDNYMETPGELLAISRSHHAEIVQECPVFTGYTVHLMLDRARSFNSSALQDEKMMSLGRLSAGLAHELNNPASATVRTVKQLGEHLQQIGASVRDLAAAALTENQLATIERARAACVVGREAQAIGTALEQHKREAEIDDWLSRNGLGDDLAFTLADSGIDLAALDELAEMIPGEALFPAVRWIATQCAMQSLLIDIEHSATRIHELVSAVKRFTYMDKMVGQEQIDIDQGLRDAVRMIASKIGSKDARVTIDIEEGLPPVDATGSELNQIWLNLLDNALDAIEAAGSVTISARRELGRVVVRIVDDGPGIPDEALGRIFDPFFTTKPPGQGTGLGLDIVQRLVRRHSGDLNVESVPGRTEFRVTLNPSSGQG